MFKFLKNDQSIFEKDCLPKLVKNKQLMAFKHHGFWGCMDTLREKIILTNIYGAGEKNINNINSSLISTEIFKLNKNVKTVKDNNEIRKNFNHLTKENDLIINMGAGDCHNLWQILTSQKY